MQLLSTLRVEAWVCAARLPFVLEGVTFSSIIFLLLPGRYHLQFSGSLDLGETI